MRGKDRHYAKNTSWHRITPAYAGKRAVQVNRENIDKDHPRLCGEKANHRALRLRFAGSPPPMRGKVSAAGDVTGVKRITPAYAGKSK